MNFLKEIGLQDKDQMHAYRFDDFFTLGFSRKTDRFFFKGGNDKILFNCDINIANQIADLIVETSRGCLDSFSLERPNPNHLVYTFHKKEKKNESETLQEVVSEVEG